MESDAVRFDIVNPQPEKGPRTSNVVRLDPLTASEQHSAA